MQMNKIPKRLEIDWRVIALFNKTIQELCIRAHRGGIRQPFKVEISDENDEIFYMTGIRFNGGEPNWDRNYPKHRGRVTVSLREHTRVSRTIDTSQIEESDLSKTLGRRASLQPHRTR